MNDGYHILQQSTPNLRTRKIPPPPAVIGKLLYRGYMSLLAGEPGIGKSFLAVSVCVAALFPELHLPGFEVREANPLDDRPKPLTVAFVSNDQTKDTFDERLQATLGHHNLPDDRLPTNLMRHTIDRGPLILGEWVDGAYCVTDAGKKLAEDLRRFRPDVVIFDPIHDNYAIDEKDNSQWLRALDYDADLRQELHFASLLLMHTRKEAWHKPLVAVADIRGGGAIIGKSMVAVTLSALDTKDSKRFGFRTEERGAGHRLLRQLRNNLEAKDGERLIEHRVVETVSKSPSVVALPLADDLVSAWRDFGQPGEDTVDDSPRFSPLPGDDRTAFLRDLAGRLYQVPGHTITTTRGIREVVGGKNTTVLDHVEHIYQRSPLVMVPGIGTLRLRACKGSRERPNKAGTWNVWIEVVKDAEAAANVVPVDLSALPNVLPDVQHFRAGKQ